jgi:Polysaccharide lyase/Dockerin type I domain
VHSGKYAVRSTINTSNGAAGIRWPLRTAPGTNLLPNAYYSCWYYLPESFDLSWLNAMQWKTVYTDGTSSNPSTSINFIHDQTGMHLQAVSYLNSAGAYASSNAHQIAIDATTLPIGQWFQIETYYAWSQKNTGECSTWLNGKQIWSVKNLITQENLPPYKQPMQWSCNLYGDGTNPKTVSLYLDDLAVSTTPRLLGDINGDGHVTRTDFAAMLTALTDFNGYQTAHPTGSAAPAYLADTDRDGAVDNLDLQAELNLIGFSGVVTAAVSEPTTMPLALLALAIIATAYIGRFAVQGW